MIHIQRNSAPPDFYQLEWRTRYLKTIRLWLQQPLEQRGTPAPIELQGDKVRQLLPLINQRFAHKCAFCETRLKMNQQMLMYFRPQGNVHPPSAEHHYYWLALDWSNLYLSCRECFLLRGSEFPVEQPRVIAHVSHLDRENAHPYFLAEQPLLLDPCVEVPIEHLDFNENGTIATRNRSPRGKRTIEIFELNRDSLVEKRRHEAQQLKTIWREARKQTIESTGNIDGNLVALVDKLEGACDKSAQFAGMKAFLLLEWLNSAMTAADDSADIFCAAIEKEPWKRVYQKTLETLRLEKPLEAFDQVDARKPAKTITESVSTIIQKTGVTHIYINGDMYQIDSISHSNVAIGQNASSTVQR